MPELTAIGNDDFDMLVLRADGPVLVDFWAPWCGSCRLMTRVLGEVANDRNDLRVVTINIDESPDIPAVYDVQSVPTLLLFRDGALVDRIVGAVPKTALLEAVDAALA